MKYITSLLLVWISVVGYAHQPDLSTSVLSKTKEGKYVLQVTSALTAFEGEIDYLYGKGAYITSVAFQDLVIDHFTKNVHFIMNGTDTLAFRQPVVILGHETKLIAEVTNMPSNLHSIYYSNKMFKDMPHNQMVFIMLNDLMPSNQYVLDNQNGQTVKLSLKQGAWQQEVLAAEVLASSFPIKSILYIVGGVIIVFLISYYFLIQKEQVLV